MRAIYFIGCWWFILVMLTVADLCDAESLFEFEALLKGREFESYALEHGIIKPITSLPKKILTVNNIEIGLDSISGVLSKVGDAYLTKGAGESGSYGLCYRSKRKKDYTISIFETGPSGGWRTIDGFSLIESDSTVFKGCITSDFVSADLMLGSGLRLGMTEDELNSILQAPSIMRGEWRGYIYEGKRKIKGAEYDIVVSIIIRVIGLEIKEIHISKGEFS